MDVATDLALPETRSEPENTLSYDESVAYEHQVPTTTEEDPRSSLASRIGNTKIYLLSEASAAARSAKRKHEDDEDEIIFDRTKRTDEAADDNEIEMEETGYRANAILLQGSPISQLSTARLFAYAKHFDTAPLGLEWVNDQTCIFVFESNSLARTAFTLIQKSSLEDPDADDLVTAKPIPVALWPAEARINQTLGKGEGLKGALKMRWARSGDVKKKGAKKESEFYKRHGIDAGKELYNGRDLPPAKRVRRDDGERVVDQDSERRRLDDELDRFLQESDGDEPQAKEEVDEVPSSPPSKMRSDYIARDGRTLLDRFSDTSLFVSDQNPAERPGLKDRLTMPLPKRARGGRRTRRGDDNFNEEVSSSGSLWDRISSTDVDSDGGRRKGGLGRHNRDSRGARRGARGEDRPKMTQEELDAELDAFRQGP